jgi:TonB family protein
MQEAMKGGGTETQTFGGPTGAQMPGGGGYGGGGGGQGYLGGGLEMLTPTEGVDFNAYLARVLASVKRNWYSVMPESARLGDRGKVVLQFRIMRNGVVPDQDPYMMGSSGKEPLDRAAASSIRASTPFEPLPSAFSGPYIELRFIFLYNIPMNSQNLQ